MSDHDEESGKLKAFQVVDRRRFDTDGNERDGTTPSAPPNATLETVAKPAQSHGTNETGADRPSQSTGPDAGGSPNPAAGEHMSAAGPAHAGAFRMEPSEPKEGDVTFTSFVMSMATQALMQMGEMDAPPGMEIPVDVESAQQTIDILSMLQRKTRGNLSPDEGRFIEEVLHTLRMSYVRAAR